VLDREARVCERKADAQVGTLVIKEPLMKTLRNRLLTIVTLGWATIGFWTVPVSAQGPRTVAQGHFTLPSEVHWQSSVLPPGDYTFSLQETPSWTTVGLRGPGGQTQIFAPAMNSEASKESSRLTIANRDGVEYVQDFYVAEAGLHLTYAPPKAPKGERLLAKRQKNEEKTTVALSGETK
jgi:hypothetical protein